MFKSEKQKRSDARKARKHFKKDTKKEDEEKRAARTAKFLSDKTPQEGGLVVSPASVLCWGALVGAVAPG